MPTPRLLFLVMSAQQPAALVEQLADAVWPHPMVVHHDFTKRSDFRIDRPNVSLITRPTVTGWGTWGFCEAILRSLEICLDQVDFDYLQLLSPSSLPIRPIAEYAETIAASEFDAHADLIDLRTDADTWITYAPRAHLRADSWRLRAARRIAGWHFGPGVKRDSVASLEVLRPPSPPRGALAAARHAVTAGLLDALSTGPGAGHLYDEALKPYVGSTWFGGTRPVCEHLVREGRDERLASFFSGLANIDEHFFPTLLGNSPFRIGPSNHGVSRFGKEGHPVCIGPAELDTCVATGRSFARKFPDDPLATVRLIALALAGRSDLVRALIRESNRPGTTLSAAVDILAAANELRRDDRASRRSLDVPEAWTIAGSRTTDAPDAGREANREAVTVE